jgi:hypothetical protein
MPWFWRGPSSPGPQEMAHHWLALGVPLIAKAFPSPVCYKAWLTRLPNHPLNRASYSAAAASFSLPCASIARRPCQSSTNSVLSSSSMNLIGPKLVK